MKLSDIEEYGSYKVLSVSLNDYETEQFLFSLGLYSGETVTLLKKTSSGCLIVVKDARYNIDRNLANCIEVEKSKE